MAGAPAAARFRVGRLCFVYELYAVRLVAMRKIVGKDGLFDVSCGSEIRGSSIVDKLLSYRLLNRAIAGLSLCWLFLPRMQNCFQSLRRVVEVRGGLDRFFVIGSTECETTVK